MTPQQIARLGETSDRSIFRVRPYGGDLKYLPTPKQTKDLKNKKLSSLGTQERGERKNYRC